jgi:hypothetical protein
MRTNRKAIFFLAIASAFSTASASTAYYYFHTEQISGLHCQEDFTKKSKKAKKSQKARLAYISRGVYNKSKKKSAVANCPINMKVGSSYTINTVAFSNGKNGGYIDCVLIEIATQSGYVIETYPNSAHIDGNSTSLITWYDIEHSAADGMFTLSCKLLPDMGITSTSVSMDRRD